MQDHLHSNRNGNKLSAAGPTIIDDDDGSNRVFARSKRRQKGKRYMDIDMRTDLTDRQTDRQNAKQTSSQKTRENNTKRTRKHSPPPSLPLAALSTCMFCAKGQSPRLAPSAAALQKSSISGLIRPGPALAISSCAVSLFSSFKVQTRIHM